MNPPEVEYGRRNENSEERCSYPPLQSTHTICVPTQNDPEKSQSLKQSGAEETSTSDRNEQFEVKRDPKERQLQEHLKQHRVFDWFSRQWMLAEKSKNESAIFMVQLSVHHKGGARKIGKNHIFACVEELRFVGLPADLEDADFLGWSSNELSGFDSDKIRRIILGNYAQYEEQYSRTFARLLVTDHIEVDGWRMCTKCDSTSISHAKVTLQEIATSDTGNINLIVLFELTDAYHLRPQIN